METDVLPSVTVPLASDASEKEADLPTTQTFSEHKPCHQQVSSLKLKENGSSKRMKFASQPPAHVSKIVDYEGIKSDMLSELVAIEKERLVVDKMRLALEERQAVALEKLVLLKQDKLSMTSNPQLLSLSPDIKFN